MAVDSVNSKSALRNLFSKFPAWNEASQAIVINGSRTNNHDFDKLENIAFKILQPLDNDATGSEFQQIFARFAYELSAKKIDFKLYVSINPAHFLTMSNPKHDERGSTMVSCDNYSFIVFTASNPNNPETLNNREYCDLIQHELSALENVSNLWITRDYYQNEFNATICAKISVRKDKLDLFNDFEIGTYGFCIICGEEIDSGLYCDSC